MFDRRFVTDAGLALLIALPSVLPAAPGPWNSDDEVGRPDALTLEMAARDGQQARFADRVAMSQPRYGSS